MKPPAHREAFFCPATTATTTPTAPTATTTTTTTTTTTRHRPPLEANLRHCFHVPSLAKAPVY